MKNWVSTLKLIPATLRRNNDRNSCSLEFLVLSIIGSFGSFDIVSVLSLWKSRFSLRTRAIRTPEKMYFFSSLEDPENHGTYSSPLLMGCSCSREDGKLPPD